MSEKYDPLVVTVEKFKGNRDGLESIFKAIMAGVKDAKNNQFTLKLVLKEIDGKQETEVKP